MMKNLFQILCGLFLVVSYSSCMHSEEDKVDVLIIGGGASGVTSGIQSARMGANTLILEESTWLGGCFFVSSSCAFRLFSAVVFDLRRPRTFRLYSFLYHGIDI